MSKKSADSKPEKPSKFEELDFVKFQVLNERLGRLEAQRMLLEKQAAQTAEDKARCQAEMKAFGADLQKKYSITERDSINMETGEISRAE